MTCIERKKFQDLQEDRDRTERVLRARIERERQDRRTKQLDTFFIGVAGLMCGTGAAAFIYALSQFARWAQFGW